MVTNFKNQSRKKDLKQLFILILFVAFVFWLYSPPGYRYLNLYLWNNNVKMFLAEIQDREAATAYILHRNNAVYYAKMNKKEGAFAEINKAIELFPEYGSENTLRGLYKDKAMIHIYFKSYKEALNNYLRANVVNIYDNLRLAMLLKENGNYKEALGYCNEIINTGMKAYAGYACAADIYAGAGRLDSAIRIYDLLIEKTPKNANHYVERAEYKRLRGDIEGYNEDMAIAKSFSNYDPNHVSIIKEAITFKRFDLPLLKS